VPAIVETPITTLSGPWTLGFPTGPGAPAEMALPALTSWTDSTSTAVRYFSGTGTYRKTIDAPAAWFRGGGRLLLDLGAVGNVADVWIN
ncbi:glycosylhydrolase-like jelly roll fold domain-containing protein, partial [Pseudomonas sp. MPR-E5]